MVSEVSPKENSTQVERLLNLVPYLLAHQGISIQDLARDFGVSVSDMTKDLNTLWMCGLPGYTPLELIDLEFESGYVTIRNAQTLQDPRALTKIEVLSLILGLEILGKDGIEISALKDKLNALLGSAIAISIDAPSSSKIRGVIAQALSTKKAMSIVYHSINADSFEERLITPIEISIENGCEYLLSYCHKAHAHRSFRVDRIDSATISSGHFEDTKLLMDANTSSSSLLNIDIEISVLNRSIQERLSIRRTHSEAPFSVAITAFSREWAIRTILAGAGNLRVLGSKDLSASIHHQAMRAISLYK